MAIDKFLEDKANNKYNEVVIEDDNADPLMIYIKSLATKLDEGLTKTNTHINELTTEKNKTGITSSQANAIVANTAKTGISTEQSNFITALNQGIAQAVGTNDKKITATVVPMVTIGKKGSTLDLSIRMSDGSVYATSLVLTKIK